MVLGVVNTWLKPAEEPVREKKTSEEKPRAVLSAIALAARLRDFDPDELQVRVLESNAHRGILNCSRQWGKSTVGAVMAVHRAMTRPGSLVIVASPSDRQSAEFVRKCREMLSHLKIRVRGDGHFSITVATGKRVSRKQEAGNGLPTARCSRQPGSGLRSFVDHRQQPRVSAKPGRTKYCHRCSDRHLEMVSCSIAS